MKAFITQVILFCIVQAALALVLMQRYSVSDSDNYLAETVAKQDRLRTTGPGKIVLVGGSSAAFGFSSDILSAALAAPVINMGLAAGLGVEYMVAEVLPELEPGDTVVFSFEYEHFSRGRDASASSGAGFDPDLLEQVLTFRPAGLRDLSWVHHRRVLLRHGLRLFGGIARRAIQGWLPRPDAGSPQPGDPTRRRGFNAFGDLVSHRGPEGESRRQPVGEGLLVPQPAGFPDRRVLAFLARTTRDLADRGVTVAWSFPPRAEATIRRDGGLASQLEEALRQIDGLHVLDSPATHAYPLERFFDTQHHLDARGATLRTRSLADALAPILRSRPAPRQAPGN